MFDYNVVDTGRNKKVYGRERVPMLPLHRINDTIIPIHIFAGDNDDITVPEDVSWIKSALPKAIKNYTSYPDLNHYTILSQPQNVSQIRFDVLQALISSNYTPIPWP